MSITSTSGSKQGASVHLGSCDLDSIETVEVIDGVAEQVQEERYLFSKRSSKARSSGHIVVRTQPSPSVERRR